MNYPFLAELNYNQMRSNTSGEFSSRIADATGVQISNIQYIPSSTDKTLLVKATTKGEQKEYLSQIQFQAVAYNNASDANNGGEVVTAVDNNKYYFKKLSKNDVVKVHCSCLDFYYRFSRYHYEKQSIVGGEPERFDKHTDRAPQNPQKKPALCKHLQRLFMQLNDLRLFQG